MLPGFRFLFAAILLSTSILVFGLGAAALLRATHEQYVSNPSWRNGPQEKVFAQSPEPAQPVLAALRAEPEAAAEPTPSLRDRVPTIGLPVNEPEQEATLTTEPDVPPQVTEAAVPAAEPVQAEATTEAIAPAPADTLTPADTTASIPEAAPAVTASEPTPADPGAALASPVPDIAPAKVAALNDPAATASKDAPAKAKGDTKGDAKADSSASDSKAAKHQAKAKKRHRMVRRPPPQQLRQSYDPFGQPQMLATTATRTRQ
ncbi:hypothetical protein [Bradyrhizobium japonicum]|uniref:hypothetical protein n=1 Tax=Bradyrhizobium japonicum TaxID=375 RepID=UPI000456C872|nr:hypothetical protein [Bradyrhizobium japonicum]AHY53807.1 hypothetical protein BJS_01188 [Bradyrhizobium japonicum SEMIA 5079]MCD9106533.1 hypothetical protein [Bradyrhizobium japonicum]MCD9253873.1 hypothetical protein [Bradyrhizobium japonicum SEMIA 5079]MCD9817740.1 hypothetical protein [Bradyrhizobium japonicum]MCD9890762.1 hypothetical protein [Bradyrhizobium japonicum]